MTLQQLKYFKEAATTLHFTRAAENLYVAQSSLSHAIQALEEELGVPLFLRRNYKKVMLTTYGQTFLPYVDNILDELERGQHAIEQLVRPNSGNVNLVYTFINGHHIGRELLSAFYDASDNAGINISVRVNHGTMSFDEEISSGAADLAISCFHPDDPEIRSEYLGMQQLFVMVCPSSPLASHKSLTLEDIKDENIVMFSTSLSLYSYISRMFENSGVSPRYVDGIADWSMQVQQVANGRGVAILPSLPLSPNEVKPIPLDNPMNKRKVYLLSAANRKLSPSVEHFRRFCLAYFSRHPEM